MTTPTLTAPPSTVPNKYGGDPVAFDAAMQDWLAWEATRQPEEVALVDWVNSTATTIDEQYTAALAAGLASAATNAATATTKAAEASESAATAGTQATNAATSATQANTAKDLAIQAWSASTAPAETIAALSQVMHLGTVVDVCIDLPSKHWDGGAWIDRCQDKSWYTETLGGTAWLNTRCPDEATARAVIQSAAKPNLVANPGSPFSATTGFTATAGISLSVVGNNLRATRNDSSAAQGFSIGVATEIGSTYFAEVTVSGATNGVTLKAGTTASSGALATGTAVSISGVAVVSFVATTTTSYIFLAFSGGVSGNYVEVSLVSTKVADTAVSAAGYVYQSSASLTKFYSLTGASGQNEVWRGIKREYPRAGVAKVVESARLVEYDIGTGAMWRVSPVTAGYSLHSGTITSVAAVNGLTVIGMSTQAIELDYAAGTVRKRSATDYTQNSLGFGSQVTAGTWNVINATAVLVNAAVNDVALTALENSPIDPATGMPVPTIAIATAGGVSVIKSDGTVVNLTSGSPIQNTAFVDNGNRLFLSSGSAVSYGSIPTSTLDYTVWRAGYYNNTTIPAVIGTTSVVPTKRAISSIAGLTFIKENPTTPAKGMVAYTTQSYATGWMPGDIRLAAICAADGVTESVSATPIYFNTFDTDTTSDFTANGGIATWASNAMLVQWVSGVAHVYRSITVEIGKAYRITFDAIKGTAASWSMSAGTANGTSGYGTKTNTVTETGVTIDIVATAVTLFLQFRPGYNSSGSNSTYDNIYVRPLELDRSVKARSLVINGTLTKTPVAVGAALCALSGFSAANYLQQPYSVNQDYSTTGFSGALWLKEAPNSAIEYILNRDSLTPAQAIRLWVSVAGMLVFELYDGTTTRTALGTVAVDDSIWKLVQFDYLAGTLNVYVNAVLYATATGAALLTLNNAAALLNLGLEVDGTLPLTNGSLTLFRMSATIPSSDQREQLYRDELPLFSPGAQCTLAGTSPAVTALAYDDTTDILHAATSYGRSSFKGLLRVESEATTVGAPTALAASGGTVIMAGTSAKVYVPAKYLRDELQRREEAKKALGRIPVFFDFDAVTSQVAFVLPAGYTTKAVYSAGLLKRVGSTKDYTTNTNGYKETVTFAVAPGNTVQVTVMATRS